MCELFKIKVTKMKSYEQNSVLHYFSYTLYFLFLFTENVSLQSYILTQALIKMCELFTSNKKEIPNEHNLLKPSINLCYGYLGFFTLDYINKF